MCVVPLALFPAIHTWIMKKAALLRRLVGCWFGLVV
jgi:hypothetical protein